MPTQEKIEKVAELKDVLERASMVISTQFRGLSVKEMIELRRRLTGEGHLEVRVVKNSLLKLAADQSENSSLMEVVEGPTALAVAYEDIIEAAKTVTEYKKGAPAAFVIRGAYMDGSVLTDKDLESLTKIPPKPVLLAQIAGSLQSPLSGLVALLDAPLQELVGLLNSLLSELPGLIEARIQQIEANPELGPKPEAAAEPEPAAEETPAEEPAAEASAGEAPAEEAAPEEAPAEEAPADEAPADEPAAEPTADEPAVEETPAGESPAQEAAAEEPVDEESRE